LDKNLLISRAQNFHSAGSAGSTYPSNPGPCPHGYSPYHKADQFNPFVVETVQMLVKLLDPILEERKPTEARSTSQGQQGCMTYANGPRAGCAMSGPAPP
jgi:hypothetical protein